MSGAPASLAGQPIVPVVVIDDAAQAVGLAEALLAGGIGCAEFTLRTPAALDALAAVSAVPGFVAGVGTVITPSQLHAAADAGARFAVAPGFDEEVVALGLERGLDVVPGVATPSELSRALRAGIDHVKLYPAGALGGTDYLDALVGPFPGVRFLPSGGVNASTAATWAGHPAVFAISGSWMVPRDAIAAGDFGRIAELARAAVVSIAEVTR
ncbi:bifunctional 4-hydroxy-2-oxoglutarate aldolase/2-dehydro-3-deoxy-phosphogluconate aldolase [Herbiconiux sp. CPCC 205716]|uniref:Bifunctional 4-hydroxy-2-oxoglutarate aldolase/2-dehydro-3-deoxy-phosphogluconate aldolase n=1 Tax=Herbiconiux gentiana TaxID=2970912 RepID=A0ABT2GEZ0_9MICO|nr:bifunctional 4-hydroxy-2-oxoglutarate aldolase/2-dehydro-3-deoxy-phosphogluconate aldolase [Herbiconiux gentiana]MCS5714775.1 bifunctional 4-hydroxy-2-oxoglutarate aldolase/2-dehydro-3-deoxy-phosphogluconate aldolase [Herbiconiux gentiana]